MFGEGVIFLHLAAGKSIKNSRGITMRRYLTLALVLGMGTVIFLTGCFKKSSDQINISSDPSLETTTPAEDLTQFPSSVTNANQVLSQALEPLPIEPAPVTPAAPIAALEAAGATASESVQPVSHNQKIQAALKNAGLYTGKIDGKIGPKTKKAIETFQAQHNLKADGKVGPKTWALLEGYLSGAPQEASASSTLDPAAMPVQN